MELFEAINARKSIRGFKADPVSREVLMELFGVSTRSPSGVNCQPWEIFIARGGVLERLKNAYVEQYRQGVKPEPVIYEGMKTKGIAPPLSGVYRERQVQLGKQTFQALGIGKGDHKGMQEYYEKMYRFYDAPAVIITCADESLLLTSVSFDLGLLTQTIALAAQQYGLGTCIMRAIVDYPEMIKEIVGIPQSKKAVMGIAIGYPDWDAPINRIRTEREPLEKILWFVE
jgi:nitroreductase